jgi:hypothetical protein
VIVLAVAERAHVPDMSARAEARYARTWVPWAKPALAWPGATQRRWEALLAGAQVTRVVNLLPPARAAGAWDAADAAVLAVQILHWATQQQGTFARGEEAQLIFLGRRVERAFLGVRGPQPWGRPYDLPFDDEAGDWYGAVWCMTIPHPSGRNREYNDPVIRARVQRALARFCAEVK